MNTRRSFLASPLALVAAAVVKAGVPEAEVKEVPIRDRVLVVSVPMKITHEAHHRLELRVRAALAEGGHGQVPVLVMQQGVYAYSVPLKGERREVTLTPQTFRGGAETPKTLYTLLEKR